MARPHSTKPRSDFALRLIKVRQAFGVRNARPDLDQKQFAAILGVGDEAYRRYERGETEPKLATLVRLKQITGTSLDWLISGQESSAAAHGPRPKLVRSGSASNQRQ